MFFKQCCTCCLVATRAKESNTCPSYCADAWTPDHSFASWVPSGDRFQLSGSQPLLCSAPCDLPIHLWSRRWCRSKQLSKKWQLGVAKVEVTRHTTVTTLQSCTLVEYRRQPCICTGGGDQRAIRVSSLSLGVVRNNTHTHATRTTNDVNVNASYFHDRERAQQFSQCWHGVRHGVAEQAVRKRQMTWQAL